MCLLLRLRHKKPNGNSVRRRDLPTEGLLLENDLLWSLHFILETPPQSFPFPPKKEHSDLPVAGCAGDKSLHSSMCTLLLTPVSSLVPVFCPLLYILSLSPGPPVLIQNKPAASARFGIGESVDRTHSLGKQVSPISPEASHHLPDRSTTPSPAVLSRVLGRKLNVILVAFLSHQHLPTSGFLSSTLSSIHYPFAADGCHLSLLLSPRALFFFYAFLLVFDSFIFTLMRFGEGVQWKACV